MVVATRVTAGVDLVAVKGELERERDREAEKEWQLERIYF